MNCINIAFFTSIIKKKKPPTEVGGAGALKRSGEVDGQLVGLSRVGEEPVASIRQCQPAVADRRPAGDAHQQQRVAELPVLRRVDLERVGRDCPDTIRGRSGLTGEAVDRAREPARAEQLHLRTVDGRTVFGDVHLDGRDGLTHDAVIVVHLVLGGVDDVHRVRVERRSTVGVGHEPTLGHVALAVHGVVRPVHDQAVHVDGAAGVTQLVDERVAAVGAEHAAGHGGPADHDRLCLRLPATVVERGVLRVQQLVVAVVRGGQLVECCAGEDVELVDVPLDRLGETRVARVRVGDLLLDLGADCRLATVLGDEFGRHADLERELPCGRLGQGAARGCGAGCGRRGCRGPVASRRRYCAAACSHGHHHDGEDHERQSSSVSEDVQVHFTLQGSRERLPSVEGS